MRDRTVMVTTNFYGSVHLEHCVVWPAEQRMKIVYRNVFWARCESKRARLIPDGQQILNPGSVSGDCCLMLRQAFEVSSTSLAMLRT